MVFTVKCQPGEEYKYATKSCTQCMKGWYKDVDGNIDNCTKCQTTRTTLGAGSISQDNCTEREYTQHIKRLFFPPDFEISPMIIVHRAC